MMDDLESLLAESVSSAKNRERTAFDALAAPYERDLVLFGAGGLGRRTLSGLTRQGIRPLAFSDNNAAIWGTSIDGVPVVDPRTAARLYGSSAVFVVTIWGAQSSPRSGDRIQDRIAELKALGCKRVVQFGFLFWKFASDFLPYYSVDLPHKVLEKAQSIRQAASFWADDASRDEYYRQVRWRLQLDFDTLNEPVKDSMYFPSDLYKIGSDEVFVDCGAFDGDTVEAFLGQCNSRFRKIVALEPDPENFGKLQAHWADLIRAGEGAIYPFAVGARYERLSFSANGSEASRVSSSGLGDVVMVESLPLDQLLADAAPTLIKMDIEGSELDALRGASRIIQENKPILAISAYHRQSDLWEIPIFIESLNGGYRFFLRPHKIEVWDLICYAIPEDRCLL